MKLGAIIAKIRSFKLWMLVLQFLATINCSLAIALPISSATQRRFYRDQSSALFNSLISEIAKDGQRWLTQFIVN
ncbi:hypothetical protein [Nostoc sp. MS1]|uniref:hypothetical protein n=1 Tax=Nostoc sp. MS1 TaxID=2764711 RepID=UPI001CC5AF5C|nr:hypothetical protein [Nostoc sp. MS1]